jgi:predicted MFS family arabinose efflux permease
MTSRPVLAVALGALIGFLLSAFMGWLGDYVFPPSVLADMNPALARTMPMPFGEIMMELIGWGGATVLGAMLALRFADETGPWPAWAVAAVLAGACVLMAFFSPHPLWFVILCVIVIAASGYGAGRMTALQQDYAEPDSLG